MKLLRKKPTSVTKSSQNDAQPGLTRRLTTKLTSHITEATSSTHVSDGSDSSSKAEDDVAIWSMHANPLGFNVVFEPDGLPTMDIVFAHGLVCTSRMTWSPNRDLKFFWPQEWLSLEPEINTARVLTFGYNADFLSAHSDIFKISDFAKELLLRMQFGSDEGAQSLKLGSTLILFVVCCSMYWIS